MNRLFMMLMVHFCVFFVGITYADDSRDVVVKAWVDPAENIITSQQLMLNIEVATPSYFVGGTRIVRPEIADAIVLQREVFAVNSTRRVDGETWAVQLWTMTIYPQRAGMFDVPQIRVEATIALPDGQPQQRYAQTEAVQFEVRDPSGIPSSDIPRSDIPSNKTWLATSSFSVTEEYDGALDNLKIGDSVTRVIKFKANNLAAMMLPEIGFPSRGDGLAIYPKPPTLNDRVNRGEYLAERIETISYVVEKPGTFVLPERQFYWFDLDANEFKVEVLPELSISTALNLAYYVRAFFGGVLALLLAFEFSDWLLLALLVGGLYVSKRHVYAGWALVTRMRRDHRERRALETKFVDECRTGNFTTALGILYRRYDLSLEQDGRDIERGASRGADRSIRQHLSCMQRASMQQGVDSSTLKAEFEELMVRAFAKAEQKGLRSDQKVFRRFIKALFAGRTGRPFSGMRLKQVSLKLN